MRLKKYRKIIDSNQVILKSKKTQVHLVNGIGYRDYGQTSIELYDDWLDYDPFERTYYEDEN